MAGAILDRELKPARASRVRFDVATRDDDAGIRRLLRENPMPGQISLSLEREPDYFADAELPGEEKQTIVAREAGRVVCAGSCTVRDRFVNGKSRRVGYLGGLRLDASFAGRFDIVRRGYEIFRELQAAPPADFYFTSIAADNVRARQFLERGLPGMPTYEFIGEFITLMKPVSNRAASCRTPPSCFGGYDSLEKLTGCLNEHNRHFQFAPRWTADELIALQSLGLQIDGFHVVSEDGRIAACAALWDQRAFKQTVIRGYAPRLKLTRPLLNIGSHTTGNPRLPAVGETLANAFVSHLAVASDKTNALPAMITELSGVAAQRGIELLTLGFAANDPRLAAARNSFRCREYRSRLYVVRWPEMGGAAGDLDGRCPGPEVALL